MYIFEFRGRTICWSTLETGPSIFQLLCMINEEIFKKLFEKNSYIKLSWIHIMYICRWGVISAACLFYIPGTIHNKKCYQKKNVKVLFLKYCRFFCGIKVNRSKFQTNLSVHSEHRRVALSKMNEIKNISTFCPII